VFILKTCDCLKVLTSTQL